MNAASHMSVRSLYRRVLRELPATSTVDKSSAVKASILSKPSPLQRRIRSQLSGAETSSKSPEERLEAADQLIQYLRAQRVYTTLIERYNPGMNMDEEERVRLSARRIGVQLPAEFGGEGSGEGTR